MIENDAFKLLLINLFHLNPDDIANILCTTFNKMMVLLVTLTDKHQACPYCGFTASKIKEYVTKEITHSALTTQKCIIKYRARRYKCSCCGKTYYEFNPFVFKSQKISILTVHNILKDLKDFNETFTSVARRYHVSPTSVSTIFDNHVDIGRNPLPEIINFDEVYAFKSEKSKYVCVLLDFKKQIPVDVLPNRKKEYLLNYFQKIPLEERKKVKYACSDMYEVYRDVVHKVFPNSVCILDYFHLSQDFHRKMNEVRIKVMKGYKDNKASDEYYLLKKFNWLLFKNPEDEDKYGRLFDVERERKYNSHFKSYMNYYDLRKKLLEINNDLTICYSLKLELVDFYSKSTVDNAKENLENLIRSCIDTNIDEMIAFSNNLINWKQEIINSFTIVGTEYKVEADKGQVVVCNKKVNNAIIENRNKIIKCIKNNANGYTNWSRFRNRVMYVLDPNATFTLEPREKQSWMHKT